MKIIGAGFGRTGTASLQAALEQLGFGPCYHMVEIVKDPDQADFWLAAGAGRPVDWKGFLGRYQSGVDFPVCSFYVELMDEYPDAKVVLTVRDPEKWYESSLKTIYAMSKDVPMRWWGRYVPRMGKINELASTQIWDGLFGGRFRDKEHAIAIYQRHIEEVRRRVPADKLLVFDVAEGWEPLCRFLDVPVPDGPFPRLNDMAVFQRRVRIMKVASWAMVLLPAVLLGGVLARRR